MIYTSLNDELILTRTLFRGGSRRESTLRQVQKLAILFREAGIASRDTRLAILREWSGDYQLKSSKDLSLHITSKMIDYLIDEETGGLTWNGLLFITELADRVKARPIAIKSEDDIARNVAILSGL